jgi:hypothetical protein
MREHEDEERSRQLAVLCNFAEFPVILNLPDMVGRWKTVLDSASASWKGPESNPAREITLATAGELRLSPQSFLVVERIQANTEAV